MDGYLDQQVPYTLANVRMDVNFQCFFCFVCVLLSPPVRFYVSLCVCFGESASRRARVFVPKQQLQRQKQQQKQQVCGRYRKKKYFITSHKSATKYSRATRLVMFVSAGCSVAQFGWTCAKWSLSSEKKPKQRVCVFSFFFSFWSPSTEMPPQLRDVWL